MSFFIAARKDTKAILETGARSPHLTDAAYRTAFRAALCSNHSVADANLELYYADESNPTVAQVMDGASYAPTWSGTTITGIDLTAETSKRIIKVSASKALIVADGADTTTITIEVWKADDSGIETGLTASSDMPIQTPDGSRTVRVSVVNGVATRVFKTQKTGIWTIPGKKRFANVRVGQAVSIEAVLDFSTL